VSRDLLLALIGTGGVVLGALVSGIPGVWVAQWTTSIADRHAQDQRRRQAYDTFIIALDNLETLFWKGPAPLDETAAAKLIGPQTGPAVAAIQQAYVAVLLTGSEPAREAADMARRAAWAIDDHLNPQAGKARGGIALETLMQKFTSQRKTFITQAQKDLGLDRVPRARWVHQ
jgi:hypothetical protein